MDKTLLKGLQVLDHIARGNGKMRITDVASELNLTKSNAYRVLKTLECAGFVRQDLVSKSFAPSMKIWELGMQLMNRLDLRGLSRDTLRQLANESRETVHLAVLDGRDVIYVDKIDSVEPVASYTRLAGRAPAHCVATGKALLSQLSPAELAPVLAELAAYSEYTITDRDAMIAELAEARRLDYAINRGEWRESVWGLASAVHDPSGAVVAAVGVSGPRYRLDSPERCAELAAMVLKAKTSIENVIRA